MAPIIETQRNVRRPQGCRKKKEESTRGFLRKCHPPEWLRFLVTSKDRSVEGAVSGQEDGKIRGSKHSAVFHTVWRLKAMVPRRPEHIAPSSAWQKDVKALVVNAWQVPSICRVLVAGLSCLTEPSAFTMSHMKVGVATRISTSKQRQTQIKIADEYAETRLPRCRRQMPGPHQCTPVRTPVIGDRAAAYLVNSSGPMGSVRVSIFEPNVVVSTVCEMAY